MRVRSEREERGSWDVETGEERLEARGKAARRRKDEPSTVAT
jgi:hypothetical protein